MTEPITICWIARSLRARSYNRAFLRAARSLAPESRDIRIFDRVGDIPLFNQDVEDEREAALANQSVKRFVDPGDIAALPVFLAGPHGRSISGQMLPIDGDSKSTV